MSGRPPADLRTRLLARLARFGRPGKIGLRVLEIGAAAYLGLGFAELLGVPSRALWEAEPSIPRTLLVLLAVSLISTASWRIRTLERRIGRHDGDAQRAQAIRVIEEGCRFLLVDVAEHSGLDPLTLGVSVWRGAADGERLIRVQRYRIASRQPCGVAWVKGKGTIGRCWVDNDRVLTDLDPLRDLTMAKEQYEQLPDDLRMGMSWGEFGQTAMYRAVWAEPLREDSGNWRGCLSVDCEARGSAEVLRRRVIKNRNVLSTVETVSVSLLRMLALEEGR